MNSERSEGRRIGTGSLRGGWKDFLEKLGVFIFDLQKCRKTQNTRLRKDKRSK
jgi:hypothetical protein